MKKRSLLFYKLLFTSLTFSFIFTACSGGNHTGTAKQSGEAKKIGVVQ
ncbi:hypothetical protein [Paenibacillus sp.]|nr:hypothetical protein [Paenibacillus sp.]